ncbi:MAG: hypothetical protein EOO38_12775 [Cytophagaceae bacterium]|nr:MAG: hypothetical protein EOO38_12775 [Cytophagaceae bacterium]
MTIIGSNPPDPIRIGSNPPNPRRAAAKALKGQDYRIAGVTTFWGSAAIQRPDYRPYGLRCKAAPDTAYAYVYEVSDAIGVDAFEGYAKQISFLKAYNQAMLKSGKLPAEWGCALDPAPGKLGG